MVGGVGRLGLEGSKAWLGNGLKQKVWLLVGDQKWKWGDGNLVSSKKTCLEIKIQPVDCWGEDG